MKKFFLIFGLILLLTAITLFSLYRVYVHPVILSMKQTQMVQFDDYLTILQGGGGNSGIFVSDSLVVVIDTKMDEAADELYKWVLKLGYKKPILVINTHHHPDHSSGNYLYKGHTIIGGSNMDQEVWREDVKEVSMPNLWIQDSLSIQLNNERISIYNLKKPVHTESDLVVYLHERKVLFAGDIILNNQAPFLQGNASPEAYLEKMNWIKNRFPIEAIVPGHGNIGSMLVLQKFQEYFKDMQVAAQDKDQREMLLYKYKSWVQIPFFMSPEMTMKKFME